MTWYETALSYAAKILPLSPLSPLNPIYLPFQIYNAYTTAPTPLLAGAQLTTNLQQQFAPSGIPVFTQGSTSQVITTAASSIGWVGIALAAFVFLNGRD